MTGKIEIPELERPAVAFDRARGSLHWQSPNFFGLDQVYRWRGGRQGRCDQEGGLLALG